MCEHCIYHLSPIDLVPSEHLKKVVWPLRRFGASNCKYGSFKNVLDLFLSAITKCLLKCYLNFEMMQVWDELSLIISFI